ncbi:MAG: hypothetical protein C4520_09415 [Candidatus Abyssobacteria bacterium SURF_5]|uniref:Uncharacterized protein n=1 Tax=Abyssobacteria bacterium (strain SURF_5) TaxID=2093360 RepID=A0A3A4NSF6_ABYX5|nr:MAG: hypothetical protein C4520_09415 [Candidatus Abyssubacteria bacterium SURF_5]
MVIVIVSKYNRIPAYTQAQRRKFQQAVYFDNTSDDRLYCNAAPAIFTFLMAQRHTALPHKLAGQAFAAHFVCILLRQRRENTNSVGDAK